jgi:hypothetical protein
MTGLFEEDGTGPGACIAGDATGHSDRIDADGIELAASSTSEEATGLPP